MGFSINVVQTPIAPKRSASPMPIKTMLGILAAVFAAFCVYDYSAYGGGYVSAALGSMQYSFQRFVLSFRLRM